MERDGLGREAWWWIDNAVINALTLVLRRSELRLGASGCRALIISIF